LQAQEERHPQGLSRADMVFGVPYSKIINASFAYTGQGARFHSATSVRGAWYCALDLRTATAEVAYHRIRMLAEIGRDAEADIPYRQFVADVHAQDFAWLDDRSKRTRACLDPDSYAAGQALGEELRERDAAVASSIPPCATPTARTSPSCSRVWSATCATGSWCCSPSRTAGSFSRRRRRATAVLAIR
jgi:hypothetical protein